MDTTYKALELFLVLLIPVVASATTTSAAVNSPRPAPGPLENTTDGGPFPTRHVMIFNNIFSGSRSYTIHCKSGDNDLRLHTVGPDEVYQFKFRSNIWGSTLFYCEFRVENLGGTFEIYKDRRDNVRCPTMCKWWVTRTGVMGRGQEDEMVDITYDFY